MTLFAFVAMNKMFDNQLQIGHKVLRKVSDLTNLLPSHLSKRVVYNKLIKTKGTQTNVSKI